jgi:PAS domain S-box-containing protein
LSAKDAAGAAALEARAREQADLFEAAFQHAAIGMALVGLDGAFLRVNDVFCRIVGISQAVLLNLDLQSLTHADDLDADGGLRQQLRLGEIDSYQLDKRYLHADGRIIWVRLAVSMVRNPDGAPRHYVAQVQDKTDQREAEAALRESEARYRLIAENTSDMIVMSDVTGRIVYASNAVRRTGWEPEELVGAHFSEKMAPEDARAVSRVFGHMLTGEPPQRVRWRGKDAIGGDWIWMESSPNLLRDEETGEPTGFLDVVRDVSLQVRQEEALAAARADAEGATAVKAQFLANMSHEIRTPLTAVVGFTSLLREDPSLSAAAAGYVAKIGGAGNALLAIVNDILDFSKLEAGRIEIRARPTDVVDVCRETLGVFTVQAEAKGLRLTFAADPGLPRAAMIDSERLRQMLVNLIGNAVKFTEAGEIGVAVLAAAQPDHVVVEVADTGPGLDAAAQALLFQKFTQIDGSMTRRHGGTGLGLAICKGLAEAMGGAIGVASTPGEGSVFRLTLPAPAADLPAGVNDDHGEIPAIDGTRVFVVDDNPVNLELARRVLEAAGCEVTAAGGGIEALERLAQLPVDIVLMDLRMPGLNGHRTLARLRKAGGPNQDIPVMAFTADADIAGDGELDAFSGVVRKPIAPLEMYATIAAATQWSGHDEHEDEEDIHAAAG